MNNINKKIIVFAIIITFIISIILIIMLNILKKEKNQETEINGIQYSENGSSFLDTYGEIINNSIDEDAYFDINTCISKYLDVINIEKDSYYIEEADGRFVKIVEEDEIKKEIYKVLSQNYIEKNNITIENLYNYVETIEEPQLFVPLEAKVIQNDDIKSFLVHGIIEEVLNYNEIKEIYIILNIDPANYTFSIEPINGSYNSISEIDIVSNEKTIEKNENNIFQRESISAITKIKDYINIYKRLALGRPSAIYEKLDNKYKEKRFGSFENFKKYIDDNKDEIINLRAEQYLFNQYSGYTEYVIKDKYENLYIFNEKAILDYSIKLDTYTIDTDKFITEYEIANSENKVKMNIDKFMQMINRHDYITSYNCISAGFKNNYFDTQLDFEEFIKEKFFKYNKFSFINLENKGSNIYVCTIQITDLTGENSNLKDIDIIIKLNDGLNFEMSFGM